VPPQLAAFAAHLGLTLHVGAMPLLGSFVGFDEHKTRLLALGVTQSHDRLFSLITQLPKQYSMALLRNCALPLIGHLERTLPPAVAWDSAAYLTGCVLDTFGRVFGVDDMDAHKSVICSPLRFGGFGLVDRCEILPHAYLSGVTEALPFFDENLSLTYESPSVLVSCSRAGPMASSLSRPAGVKGCIVRKSLASERRKLSKVWLVRAGSEGSRSRALSLASATWWVMVRCR
jgi:hypothetical protein